MKQENRIALVTGGSRGLGRSIAQHLADQGVGVVLTYLRDAQAAQATQRDLESRGVRARTLQLDSGDTSQFEAAREALEDVLGSTWGRSSFDLLIHNAGHGVHAPFAETTEEQFDGLMNVHLKGVFFLTQRLLPLLADGGRIVHVSTGLTRFTYPGYGAYASMKGAVEVLTRYLAKELGGRGISVNTVAPGAIETDFGGGVVRDVAELNEQIASATALGRVGRPDDIGGAVASLLMEPNRWVNAQRLEVSGGQMI